MTTAEPFTPPFPAAPLDRAAHLRADAAAMHQLYEREDARVLALVDGRLAIESSLDRARAAIRWLRPSDVDGLCTEPPVFLGLTDETGAPRFAAAVTAEAASLHDAAGHRFAPAVDLRSLMTQDVLSGGDIAIAATAIALIGWHAECGVAP